MAAEPSFVPEGYALVSLLGSGQTSHVHLAQHPVRGPVALKLPRPELVDRPILKRMFENEVQLTLNLHHPNIVQAHDGHPTGPKAFLALEYCPGGTLDQLLLERGRVPLETAFALVLGVARGLEYAHGRNVLHRDVKPANVFLTGDGAAKLGDFGTGVYMADASKDRVGTAFYMAPELFEGGGATARSDVYSLGILAFEVIAGARPFSGDSVEALMMAHTSGLPKPLKHYRADVPVEVAQTVARAMSRDAAKRFGRVSEFVGAFVRAAGLEEDAGADSEPAAPRFGRASRAAKREEPEEKPRRSFWWFGRKDK